MKLIVLVLYIPLLRSKKEWHFVDFLVNFVWVYLIPPKSLFTILSLFSIMAKMRVV